jgi:hypothetical integral membrane protein (TIGR02206 family)
MGPDATFDTFGRLHMATLAAIAVIAATLAWTGRRGGTRTLRALRVVLAAAMVASSLSEIALGLLGGRTGWRDVAPLQLCDVALMLGALTLLTLDRRVLEPFVCFALTGTVIALLTPELPGRLTVFRFLAYFGLHGLTVAAAVFVVVGLGVRPARGSWWRALLWLDAYAVVVTLVNLAAGTNYLYLRAKPVTASPFDWMGPWPFYLVTLEVLCAVLFFGVERLLRLSAGPSGPGVSPGSKSDGTARPAPPTRPPTGRSSRSARRTRRTAPNPRDARGGPRRCTPRERRAARCCARPGRGRSRSRTAA